MLTYLLLFLVLHGITELCCNIVLFKIVIKLQIETCYVLMMHLDGWSTAMADKQPCFMTIHFRTIQIKTNTERGTTIVVHENNSCSKEIKLLLLLLLIQENEHTPVLLLVPVPRSVSKP